MKRFLIATLLALTLSTFASAGGGHFEYECHKVCGWYWHPDPVPAPTPAPAPAPAPDVPDQE